ncbi:alkaline phosphatase, partial [Haematococcus lacustris]
MRGRKLLQAGNSWGQPAADAATAFPQGVASGDPTHEGFIIWARAPSQNATAVVRVDWAVASDSEFKQVKQQGSVVTTLDVDWSVKELLVVSLAEAPAPAIPLIPYPSYPLFTDTG